MRLFAAEQSGTAQLYGPDGSFELVPLHFFQLVEEDLAAVGRAVAQLGTALLPGGEIEMREALHHFARHGQTREDLVASFAQAHGVLDLAADDDSVLLLETLAPERGRVVLDQAQDEAYHRFTERFLALHPDDTLQRFLFRGR
jgi:streptomycin 6-kinase